MFHPRKSFKFWIWARDLGVSSRTDIINDVVSVGIVGVMRRRLGYRD